MENIETIDYATRKSIEDRSQARKNKTKWKRRVLGGLAGILASAVFFTNTNFWNKTDKIFPGALNFGCSLPINWSFSPNNILVCYTTEGNNYLAYLIRKDRALEFDFSRVGNVPADQTYYVDDYEKIYNKEVKMPF